MAQDEREMKVVYERPHALLPVVTTYCPGCPHVPDRQRVA